jgi:hypothetical protein
MDYGNGKIYSIRSNRTDDVYIGSTTQPLHKRLYSHRSHYKYWKNGKVKYMTSFKILEYDDAYIELVEEFPCKNKMELNRREGQLIRENENAVNKLIAGRTRKEYREDNKDKMSKYREDNRDKINEKQREYIEENRDEINEKNREYYQDNKDEIKERRRQRYQENKDKLNEKFDCVCGGKYTHNNKSRHLKSKKHQLYIEKQQHLQNTCNLIGSSTAKC